MSKNTSISLGDHFEGFILNNIGSGRYHSASEVIRAGLSLLELEERKIEALNEALELGERSGHVHDFNAKSSWTNCIKNIFHHGQIQIDG